MRRLRRVALTRRSARLVLLGTHDTQRSITHASFIETFKAGANNRFSLPRSENGQPNERKLRPPFSSHPLFCRFVHILSIITTQICYIAYPPAPSTPHHYANYRKKKSMHRNIVRKKRTHRHSHHRQPFRSLKTPPTSRKPRNGSS